MYLTLKFLSINETCKTTCNFYLLVICRIHQCNIFSVQLTPSMGRMLFVAAYAAAVALLAVLCKLKSLLRLGLFRKDLYRFYEEIFDSSIKT